MTERVNAERQEAARLEAQRQQQKDLQARVKGDAEKFSRVMTTKQQETGQKTTQQTQAKTTNTRTRSEAQSALVARKGIQSNQFAATLHKQGKGSIQKNEVQSKGRDDDRRRVDGEGKRDAQRVTQDEVSQNQRVTGISRDDRREGGSSGGQGERGMQGEGNPQTAAQTAAAQATTGPAPTAQPQGAQAPTLSPAILQQIASHVLVGVNEKGLSQFTVELKGHVLSGTRIEITADGRNISARFSTTDKNTERLLKASEGELARALSSKGLNLENFGPL